MLNPLEMAKFEVALIVIRYRASGAEGLITLTCILLFLLHYSFSSICNLSQLILCTFCNWFFVLCCCVVLCCVVLCCVVLCCVVLCCVVCFVFVIFCFVLFYFGFCFDFGLFIV